MAEKYDENDTFAVNADWREIRSPLDKHQLRPLGPRCKRVQFKSPLATAELLDLASFLDDYPDVELRVYGYHGISVPDLRFLSPFKNQKKFSLGIWDLDTYTGIEMLSRNLESLTLEATKHKHSLSFLSNYPDLKKLYIENQTKHIETISQLKQLEKLTLRSITVKNIDFVVDLPNLWWVAIKLGGTKDLSILGKLEQVKYVELWRILGFHELEFVSQMKGLQYLFLQDLNKVTNLPSFKESFSLRRIHIDSLKNLLNIDPISETPCLEQLFITQAVKLNPENFKIIENHPTLKQLFVHVGSVKKKKIIKSFLKFEEMKYSKDDFIFT